MTNRSESTVVLDRIRDLVGAHPEVAAVGQVTSVYLGPHPLLVTAEIRPLDALSGLRVRQLLAELRGRVVAALPRDDSPTARWPRRRSRRCDRGRGW